MGKGACLPVLFLILLAYICSAPPVSNMVHAYECPGLLVTADKDSYQFGETVMLTVEFLHVPPGCEDIAEYHYHEVIVRVDGLDLDARTLYETDVWTLAWTPTSIRTFNVTACSWHRTMSEPNLVLEACGKALLRVLSPITTLVTTLTYTTYVTSTVQQFRSNALLDDGATVVILGVAIVLGCGVLALLLERRKRRDRRA